MKEIVVKGCVSNPKLNDPEELEILKVSVGQKIKSQNAPTHVQSFFDDK